MKNKLFLIFTFCVLFVSCTEKNFFSESIKTKDFKVGFVYRGKINDRGYTQAHDLARLSLERKGIKTMYVEDVPENKISESVMKELVIQGCKMIFVTGSGYGEHVLKMAAKFSDVKFVQCSGNRTAKNVSCYSAKNYEARYLAGIVAGLKTTANRIGYVASFPTAEYIRGINAFALGVKSVNPDARVFVKWTNSLNNSFEEKYRAEELLVLGCDVLTQHLDGINLHYTAESKGAYLIGCNYPAKKTAPDSYLTSVCCKWEVFVLDEVNQFLEGTWKSRFYWEGLASGIVSLDSLSNLCIPGTKSVVENARKKIISGELKIFEGPIFDSNHNLKIQEGSQATSYDLWNMNWFVSGVEASRF